MMRRTWNRKKIGKMNKTMSTLEYCFSITLAFYAVSSFQLQITLFLFLKLLYIMKTFSYKILWSKLNLNTNHVLPKTRGRTRDFLLSVNPGLKCLTKFKWLSWWKRNTRTTYFMEKTTKLFVQYCKGLKIQIYFKTNICAACDIHNFNCIN